MTDLFGRLIDRARGEAPYVEPRKRSRFETPRLLPPVDAPAEEGLEVSATVSAAAVPPANSAPQDVPRPARAEDVRPPANRRTTPVAGDEEADRKGEPAPRRERAREALKPETFDYRLSGEPISAEPPGRGEAAVQKAPGAGMPRIQSREDQHGEPQAVVIEGKAAPERAVPQRAEEIEPSRAVPRPVHAARPPEGPSIRDQKAKRESDRGEASTEISISIGRIEVRAIRDTERPRPPSRPFKPALTLEQYMEKRDGGPR